MPAQLTFADAEYNAKRKRTRRDRFLAEMEQAMPWAELEAAIAPHYYDENRQGPGRRPIGLRRMLRMYFLQQWFALSDEGLEDAIYDSVAFRRFLDIDLGRESVPDATTLLRFRRLLEDEGLTGTLFETVNAHLRQRGLLVEQGTMVDATILHAPPSTKNKDKQRDPEMHSTKKGNQYYFGMKAHVGVDIDSGLVHTLTTTAANVADINETHRLLHGKETWICADAGYTGAQKRKELRDLKVDWSIAARRSRIKAIQHEPLRELTIDLERLKARVRARVEHPFHVIKNLFGFKKVRYKGLKKNHAQCQVLFALANVYLARRRLLA